MSFKAASVLVVASLVLLVSWISVERFFDVTLVPEPLRGIAGIAFTIPVGIWLVKLLSEVKSTAKVAKEGSYYGFLPMWLKIPTTALCCLSGYFFGPPALQGAAGEPWHWMFMLIFALICWLLAGLWLSRVRWNDSVLQATSPLLLKQRSFPWEKLTSIEENSAQFSTDLHFDGLGKAPVYYAYQGYDQVIAYAKERLENT